MSTTQFSTLTAGTRIRVRDGVEVFKVVRRTSYGYQLRSELTGRLGKAIRAHMWVLA